MGLDQLALSLWTALTEHIRVPANLSWTPTAGMAVLVLLGFLLMIRGARWARGLGSIVFLGLGALAGTHVANWLQTPQTPTIALTGVVAFLMSLGLFRLWQAVILAGCCLIAGVGAYYVYELVPAVSQWVGGGDQITLRPAGSAGLQTTAAAAAINEVQSLWSHLSATVKNFEFNMVVISVGATLVGLIFGLALPRASKSLWAATIGTFVLGVGVTGLMQKHAPQVLDWLLQEKAYAWIAVGAMWLVSFLYNLMNSGPRKKVVEEDEPVATAAPAAT